ncbi:MAG: hypothetical protein AB9903_10545 [Vulcanimicrobiota bacterium]
MISITSSEFRSRYEILDRASILPGSHFELNFSCSGKVEKYGSADVIDLNNNGSADIESADLGGNRSKDTMVEPDLAAGYRLLSKYASAKRSEIIVQDDTDELLKAGLNADVQNTTLHSKVGFFGRKDEVVAENRRSIEALVKEIEPFDKEAKWAIDCKTQEFLIYRPRA